MTRFSAHIRTVTMIAGFVLVASVVSPQLAAEGQPTPATWVWHNGVQPFDARPTADIQKDMLERMAADDARLEDLVAAMNMFTGELKLDAIARVLTIVVERQFTMRQQIMEMHGRMMEGTTSAVPGPSRRGRPAAAVTTDLEPEEMCVPTN
jgi:hypothetical protein